MAFLPLGQRFLRILLGLILLAEVNKGCTPPFEDVFGNCYFLDTIQLVQWEAAQDVCQGMGGNLLVIETPDEWDRLKGYLMQRFQDCSEWGSDTPVAWIGASPKESDNTWVWEPFGVPLFAYDWVNETEPSRNPSTAVISSCNDNFTWTTQFKDDVAHFICEEPSSESVCPVGFLHIEGHTCYSISQNLKDFLQARVDCSSQGGKLLETEEQSELTAVFDQLRQLGLCTYYYYIGATELGTNNQYHWLSNGEELSFYDWYSSEPNDNSVDNVILINCFESTDYGYFDDDGTNERLYICETERACPAPYFSAAGTGTCYRISNEEDEDLTLPEAAEKCASEGGHLVEFETATEWISVTAELAAQGICKDDRYFYIGALELGEPDQYYWLESYTLAEVYEWHEDEPSDPGNDEALGISCANSAGWKFNDLSDWTTEKLGFMCELKF